MRQFSCLTLLLLVQFSVAQNLHCKWVNTGSVVTLDSAIIEPTSISIQEVIDFNYDPTLQTLFIPKSEHDSVFVCYRVLPIGLLPKLAGRNISTYDSSRQPRFSTVASSNQIFDFGSELQKSGAISRGVTFGNRQNLFVNSSLNLQLQGKLSEELNIEAVITDQNIPYQPEGNTQQIRDFDNVFIRLYNESFDLTAGDIVLTNPNSDSYFLKYYKNVQGLQFKYQTEMNSWKSTSQVASSAAKGKFASTLVDAVEGSQGPYRLRGPNGERFIIVLANSERVFIDGRRMERGFDRDYVIDYNLGEVTFNANVTITQFTRIRIDFEYAEQFYTRTSNSVYQEFTNNKWSIRFNYYNEQDNDNSTLGFQPTPSDIDFLRTIGDQAPLARISSVDSTAFNPNQTRYKKVDTLDLDGISQVVFKKSIHPDSAFFLVNFSEVGDNQGNYVLDQTTSNGKVYKWVSPISGEMQGSYEPSRQIPLPILKEMATVSLEYQISENEKVIQEVGVSNQDRNLYSTQQDSDNNGMAWMGRVLSEGRKIGDYVFSTAVQWEIDNPTFQPIDRYRSIEFNRNWDYEITDQPATDGMWSVSTRLFQNAHRDIDYRIMRRVRSGQINGWQQEFKLNQNLGPVYFKSNHYLMENTQGQLESKWLRSSNDFSLGRGTIVPGYTFSIDQNELIEGDSIRGSRMHYLSHEYYLVNGDSTQTQYKLSYQKRQDQTPMDGRMANFTNADSYTASFKKLIGDHKLALVGTYRKVSDQQNEATDEWLNARTDWSGNFLRKLVSHRLTYQIGNVRELKREFIFLEVGGNQGTHAWRDENQDGQQDLNEFYEAINVDERQFAKIFTPTDTYITAFEARYQHLIDARFPQEWIRKTGLRSFLSLWSTQLSLNSHYRTTASGASRLNPFNVNTASDDLIFAANRWRYSFFYNRYSTGIGWEGVFSKTERKQLLTNGFELGRRLNWTSISRWRPNQAYTFRLTNSWGKQLNSSDFLMNRNVDINSIEISPDVVWQPQNSLRFIGGFAFRKKTNSMADANNESRIKEWRGNVNWSKPQSGTFTAEMKVLKIDFEGEENTYSAYQLLEALKPGQNTTWRINWLQTLGNGIQMTLQYNGRSSQGFAPVHAGTVVMTAFF